MDSAVLYWIALLFTFQYVSIKTVYPYFGIEILDKFTFQYVSIKTLAFNIDRASLEYIYIPICFY